MISGGSIDVVGSSSAAVSGSTALRRRASRSSTDTPAMSATRAVSKAACSCAMSASERTERPPRPRRRRPPSRRDPCGLWSCFGAAGCALGAPPRSEPSRSPPRPRRFRRPPRRRPPPSAESSFSLASSSRPALAARLMDERSEASFATTGGRSSKPPAIAIAVASAGAGRRLRRRFRDRDSAGVRSSSSASGKSLCSVDALGRRGRGR